MRTRFRVLLILALAVGLPTGVGAAKMVPAGGIQTIVPYAGHDASGPVTFNLMFTEKGRPQSISRFEFASRCTRHGTTVKARIRINRAGHLHYLATGILITGAVHGRQLTVTGAISVYVDGCDSDLARFTARPR